MIFSAACRDAGMTKLNDKLTGMRRSGGSGSGGLLLVVGVLTGSSGTSGLLALWSHFWRLFHTLYTSAMCGGDGGNESRKKKRYKDRRAAPGTSNRKFLLVLR